MRVFKKLKRKLDYLDEDQIELIYQSFLLAEKAHRGQKRIGGEAYITHPIAVAGILADMKMDPQTIMAAIMHDVIEDTEVTKQQIIDQFGEAVGELVDGVSKLNAIEFKSRAEAQAENFRKMVLAMSKDIRVILVKLADRLHNMHTLGPLRVDKRRRIAVETLEIYAPIAKRLGMHNMAIELEDLGFEARYPKRFQVIKVSVNRLRKHRAEILKDVEKKLKKGLDQLNLRYYHMLGREKHYYSIYRKMRDKRLTLAEIMDIYAFRIVSDTVDTCYRILGIAHTLYKPLPERFKDYIAIPKSNGYQSLHTTLFGPYGVPVELQIRTQEMDEMANYGIAAHWIYKAGDESMDVTQVRAQQWVTHLLEMQQSTGSSLEFIENVKIDLFPAEVYVFTPNGAIKQLPTGATAVDFAYCVHTDIGNTCVAAKIDRQLAPLSTVLNNGQTVEIITSPNARPHVNWLSFVVSGKARSGIRHYIKNQQRAQSISLGKQLLGKALSSLAISMNQISEQTMLQFLQEADLRSLDDWYESIGLGNRVAILDAHRLVKLVPGKKQPLEKEAQVEEQTLFIKGTEGVVVNFADCCYPLPGDLVVGVLHPGRGINVHLEQCEHIVKIRHDPERCIPVSWSNTVKGDFVASITVSVANKKGMLGKMASAISDANANIEDIIMDLQDKQQATVNLKLLVKDRGNLANVVRNLRKIDRSAKIHRNY